MSNRSTAPSNRNAGGASDIARQLANASLSESNNNTQASNVPVNPFANNAQPALHAVPRGQFQTAGGVGACGLPSSTAAGVNARTASGYGGISTLAAAVGGPVSQSQHPPSLGVPSAPRPVSMIDPDSSTLGATGYAAPVFSKDPAGVVGGIAGGGGVGATGPDLANAKRRSRRGTVTGITIDRAGGVVVDLQRALRRSIVFSPGAIEKGLFPDVPPPPKSAGLPPTAESMEVPFPSIPADPPSRAPAGLGVPGQAQFYDHDHYVLPISRRYSITQDAQKPAIPYSEAKQQYKPSEFIEDSDEDEDEEDDDFLIIGSGSSAAAAGSGSNHGLGPPPAPSAAAAATLDPSAVGRPGLTAKVPSKYDLHTAEVSRRSSVVDMLETAEMDNLRWAKTIEVAVSAIVCIKGSRPRAFDTNKYGAFKATGFIVDAEQGLILTNRHVVGAGPFLGEAVFPNHETVDVIAVYRDPVHDFGFLKYDPKKLRYIRPATIPLYPAGAKIGTEVKIIGNDAGEDISILSGHISRTDRNAPSCGAMAYSDFNTFYFQAAASLSSGSSGSPVLDIYGRAVGLHAAGRTDAATNFFLPLHRVLRALEYIRHGKQVPRGTIQLQWTYEAYDVLRRTGLPARVESDVRAQFPKGKGMLQAVTVLPKGPAAGMVEHGDILISINRKIVTNFVVVDDILDSNVGKTLEFCIAHGGELRTFHATVQDLHSVTPDRFLYISGCVIHDLSYQLARYYDHPAEGVFIADGWGPFGVSGVDNGALILSVNGKDTPNLSELLSVMKTIPDGAPLALMARNISRQGDRRPFFANLDRHWYETMMFVRNDTTGDWEKKAVPPPPPAEHPKPKTVALVINRKANSAVVTLTPSLVYVENYAPHSVNGRILLHSRGTGLVIDAKKGLLIVQRSAVPFDLSDVTLTFAEKIQVRGRVVYTHPHHSYTLLQYDPSLLGETEVTEAQFSDKPLEEDMPVTLVGFSSNERITSHESVINEIEPCSMEPHTPPRSRPINLETADLKSPTGMVSFSGVLVDSDNKVAGLWIQHSSDRSGDGHRSTRYLGIDVHAIRHVLDQFISAPSLDRVDLVHRSLCAEFRFMPVVMVQQMGLSDAWQKKLEDRSPQRPWAMLVKRVDALSPNSKLLRPLDVVLEINGQMPVSFRDLDVQFERKTLDMKVLRDGKELNLVVSTVAAAENECNRYVFWAGACFQAPYRALLQQTEQVPCQLYVSFNFWGSPADIHGPGPGNYVTHVNGVETPGLDALLEVIKTLPENDYVRMRVIEYGTDVANIITLKTNKHYWGTRELVRKNTNDPNEWGWTWIEH
ncbi:trypsin-like serine protease [Ramicandelaber brevisporus]|nr:trypsin-like serine protease [Ramicandelaber brevisporus]